VKQILTNIQYDPSAVHVLSALQHHGVSWTETRIVWLSGLRRPARISTRSWTYGQSLEHDAPANATAGQCDGILLCYICAGDGAAGILSPGYIEVAGESRKGRMYRWRDMDWRWDGGRSSGGVERRDDLVFFMFQMHVDFGVAWLRLDDGNRSDPTDLHH
jgi:hypothetical protein